MAKNRNTIDRFSSGKLHEEVGFSRGRKNNFNPVIDPYLNNSEIYNGFKNARLFRQNMGNVQLPQEIESTVVFVTDKQIKFAIKSNILNEKSCVRSYYEAYGVFAVNEYNSPGILDPRDIVNEYLKKKDNLSTEEINYFKIKFLDAVHSCGLLVPFEQNQIVPQIGDRIKVYYYDAIQDSGEFVKGFYKIINNNSSHFARPSPEALKFINNVNITEESSDEEIIPAHDTEVPQPTKPPKTPENIGSQKLSANFTLSELTRSEAAKNAGLDNTPSQESIQNLQNLVNNILQPLRDALGKSITINSSYRSQEVNSLVRGEAKSQHLAVNGEAAADIECPGMDTKELAKKIIDMKLPFDQIILEFYNPGELNSGWVHVSYRSSGGRGEVLNAKRGTNGQTIYSQGLN